MNRFMRHQMNESGNTQFRPEQFKLQKYFSVYAPKIKTELEYTIRGPHGNLIAIADLVDLTNKIVWRLNGAIHRGIRALRDEDQRYDLEELGWQVIDIKEDSWHWNWLWKRD